MMTTSHPMLTALAALAVSAGAAQAWDFSYSYQNVFAANADQYIVGQQNVRKWTEWQNPPETYWGPTASGTPGVLTLKFDFSAPTSQVYLDANLVSANWNSSQGHYGTASLWASTDGTSWTQILNCPTPGANGSVVQQVYNQNLPASLLGTSTLWLQVQMEDWGNTGAVTDAQFGRSTTANPGNIFELDALVVPEPGVCQLGLAALGVGLLWARRQQA